MLVLRFNAVASTEVPMVRVRVTEIITLLLALLLTGCVSGYKQFYMPVQAATPEAIARMRAAPPPANPIVERAPPTDSKAVTDAYLKRGYFVIGHSSFNSGRSESNDAAIQQGRDVGADLVLILHPRYTGSVTTNIPITTPTTSTSYSSSSATAYGPGGPVTAFGSGSTTTYGTSTTYMPMTVHRSDYAAVYFFKARVTLGAVVRDMNDDERQSLQTNKGVVVRLVVDGSPAFDSDILVGDVIAEIVGTPLASPRDYGELLGRNRGKQVTIVLIRRGQRIEKSVQLNP